MSNLVKRVLVGIIGIPAFVAIVLNGGYLFFALIILISNLCLWEYFKICEAKQANPIKSLSYAINTIIISILYFGMDYSISHNSNKEFLALFFATVLLSSILQTGLNLWNKKANSIFSISIGQTGFNYISQFFMSLLLIGNFNKFIQFMGFSQSNSNPMVQLLDKDWNFVVLALFVAIWSADTFAYFVGSAIGKHRLFERISPKKSWEGAVAGFIGSILGFYLVLHFAVPTFPLELSLILGGIIGIVGTMGDLAESQLKRDAGVKDSSDLIPGHGGFLDRFDSIIFTSPIILVILFVYMLINN